MNRYFVWALWDQCDEIEWMLRNLSEELRGRVSERYIAGDLRNQLKVFSGVLVDGFKDVEKGDSQMLGEVQSALENPDFREVQIQISERNKQRGARILQYLRLCGYEIEKLGVSADSVGLLVYQRRARYYIACEAKI